MWQLLPSGLLLAARQRERPSEQDVVRVAGVFAAEGLSVDQERPFSADRLLTVSEVAATMRVSNMTVYRMIKSGELSALRVGKNYRVRESELESYLSHHSVQVEGS